MRASPRSLASLACLLALAAGPVRADEWSGVVEAYAAYANESCERAEAVLAECRRCSAPGPAAYASLLRAFCDERAATPSASGRYQELVTLYPNSAIAEHALVRLVTLARTEPIPPAPGPPAPGELESAPRFRANPEYPYILMNAKIEGWVLLTFNVRPDGRVADVHVIESSPPYLFDLAAVNSLIRWVYPPHERTGLRVRLAFNLEK